MAFDIPGFGAYLLDSGFFPIEPSINVQKGDSIDIRVGAFSIDDGRVDTAWEARVGRPGKFPRVIRRASTLGLGKWYSSELTGSPAGIKKTRKRPGKILKRGRKVRNMNKENRMELHPLRRFDIVRKVVDEEVLLFDTENQQAHFINQTADFIWNLCDGTHSEEDIVRELLSKFDVSEERANRDVEILLSLLKE